MILKQSNKKPVKKEVRYPIIKPNNNKPLVSKDKIKSFILKPH